jgi:regulation of enolase protein 1 (concanavalin A-like superfamily)
MKELEGRDPNDMVNITIQGESDEEDWVYSKLEKLKEYDPGYYYSFVQTRVGFLCKISTHVRNYHRADWNNQPKGKPDRAIIVRIENQKKEFEIRMKFDTFPRKGVEF